MDFVVLGAGMMGRAVVYDLARARDVRRVIVADFDLGRAREVARKFGRGKARAAFADLRRIGKIAIAGMGGAPGTTNIMARHLCDRMERVDSIVVYNASTDLRSYDSPIAYTFSIATILDELTLLPVAFRGGGFGGRPR